MNTTPTYEIMAPAGSWECLRAAVDAGADSVYFGIGQLNMRSHSTANFTTEDLPEVTKYCNEHGVNTYLTVNTVMYDNDLDTMRHIIDTAKATGVSAIIASDVAAMQYANQIGVEVHLSTQLNIANVEALRFYAKFADVVVLARELNLDQVKAISQAIECEHIVGRGGKPVRIEMFCHGALCMAVSGKCYLSLHEFGRSANRGECMQVCRRAYTVYDREGDVELDIDNKYIMSPKDLKTIHFMNKMLDAGVSVFKIEGRARGAEYVKTTVECYKEALEAWKQGTFTDEKVAGWDKRLATVFNRGFWNGYYLGQRLGEWTPRYGSQATRKKEYIGVVSNFYKKIGVAEFTLHSGQLAVGDDFLVIGETTGLYEGSVSELRDADTRVCQSVVKGQVCSVKTTATLHRGDKVYKWVPV